MVQCVFRMLRWTDLDRFIKLTGVLVSLTAESCHVPCLKYTAAVVVNHGANVCSELYVGFRPCLAWLDDAFLILFTSSFRRMSSIPAPTCGNSFLKYLSCGRCRGPDNNSHFPLKLSKLNQIIDLFTCLTYHRSDMVNIHKAAVQCFNLTLMPIFCRYISTSSRCWSLLWCRSCMIHIWVQLQLWIWVWLIPQCLCWYDEEWGSQTTVTICFQTTLLSTLTEPLWVNPSRTRLCWYWFKSQDLTKTKLQY